MNIYERYILPHAINCACGTKPIRKQREKVVPLCEGRVLEIGMGSGLNLPYYDKDKVEFVWGLEPSEGMRVRAQKNNTNSDLEVKWLDLPSEEIPLEDDSVDSILLTYTLCTIPDWQKALEQMRRVLKPNGKLIFSEHGLAPDKKVQKWQNRLDKPWGVIAGGCHLNRDIPALIKQSGLVIKSLEERYIPGPKFASYNYWGIAKIA